MHEANRRVQGAFNSAISWTSSVELSRLCSLRVFLDIRSCSSSSLARLRQSSLIFCFSFKRQRVDWILRVLLNMMGHCFPVWEISLISGGGREGHLVRQNMLLPCRIRYHLELLEFVSIARSQLHLVWVYNLVFFLQIEGLSCHSFPRMGVHLPKALTIMRGHFSRRVARNAHWICGSLPSRSLSSLEQIASDCV